MLFSILAVVLTAYIIMLPFLMVYLVSRLMTSAEKHEPVRIMPKKKPKKVQISDKEQKVIDILSNIDAYDGSSLGQKVIEE